MGESAIVLCGGRSTRMGRDKSALAFGGETLLARVVRLVSQAADDVVLVAREGQALPKGAGLESWPSGRPTRSGRRARCGATGMPSDDQPSVPMSGTNCTRPSDSSS